MGIIQRWHGGIESIAGGREGFTGDAIAIAIQLKGVTRDAIQDLLGQCLVTKIATVAVVLNAGRQDIRDRRWRGGRRDRRQQFCTAN
jgi:hypothetical protein